MGSSFTDFRGYGFWARDGFLEVWLEVLAEVVPAEAPSWLLDAERHWRLQARTGFQGCVNADLDSRLTSDDRVEAVLALADQAYEQVSRVAGETGRVPAAWLNDRGVGGEGTVWTHDLELGSVRRIADAFAALLTGELETTAASSRVLQLAGPRGASHRTNDLADLVAWPAPPAADCCWRPAPSPSKSP